MAGDNHDEAESSDASLSRGLTKTGQLREPPRLKGHSSVPLGGSRPREFYLQPSSAEAKGSLAVSLDDSASSAEAKGDSLPASLGAA
jgi:hypothetical protein